MKYDIRTKKSAKEFIKDFLEIDDKELKSILEKYEKDVEFFETACFYGFPSVQNIVSDLVEHYNTLHSRVQVIFDENKAVAKYHLVSSTLPLVIHRNYLYAKLTSDPVRISRAERIDQLVCRLYDL